MTVRMAAVAEFPVTESPIMSKCLRPRAKFSRLQSPFRVARLTEKPWRDDIAAANNARVISGICRDRPAQGGAHFRHVAVGY